MPRWPSSSAPRPRRPLDRSRPLWELWVIEGLRDDRVALYAKVHMAAIDDVTGAEVMTALLDPDPDDGPAIPRREPVETAAGEPTDRSRWRPGSPAPLPDQLRRAAGFPGRLASRALQRPRRASWPGCGETAVEIVQRTPGLSTDRPAACRPASGEVIDEHPTGRAPRAVVERADHGAPPGGA